MRLQQLHLLGQGDWPDLLLDARDRPLRVVYGSPRSGKSTAANLATHLLYGKSDSRSRPQLSKSTPIPAGELLVEGEQGEYLLRRVVDANGAVRLTVAPRSTAMADDQTVAQLLYRRSPQVLRAIYAVDFAASPTPSNLLDEDFAREFSAPRDATALPAARTETLETGTTCREHGRTQPSAGRRNQHRIDELVRRRDALTLEIERALRESRQSSADAEQQIDRLNEQLAERRQRAEATQAELRQVEGELAQVETHLRYYSLESIARRAPTADADKQQRELERLDQDVADCRNALQNLQAREADVRRQMAEAHPDGTADSASCLADQRATIGVLERLLNDLDAEVAQLARSHEPARCPGIESHAKIVPVADMLRQQVYTLCGQLTEQQRALRRGELLAESRQLSRAQTDLSERLEHLLGRRQSIVHEMQIAGQPVVLMPHSPVAEHCHCESHGRFVGENDAMSLARSDRASRQCSAQSEQSELRRRRVELRDSLAALHAEIQQLQGRWNEVQSHRAELVHRTPVDELREQLKSIERDLQAELRGAGNYGAASTSQTGRRVWKASDILAELTGGELLQLRQARNGAAARIIDRQGRSMRVESLSPAQQDQLYLALALALASAHAHRGMHLPLVLDEPFLRQNPASTAAMAGVLEQFADDDHQLLVFTESRDAVARFQSLGVEVLQIEELREASATRSRIEPQEHVKQPSAEADAAEESVDHRASTATIRVIREGIDPSGPRLHVAGELHAGDSNEDVFYLSLEASLAEFPVLGGETESRFRAIGIRTVRELLDADAAEVAPQLDDPHITTRVVQLWQSHMTLMCFVPGVSLDDAQVLSAVDVDSPDDLAAADVADVATAIEEFLSSSRGRLFARRRARYSRRQLAKWRDAARIQRERWRAAQRSSRPAQPNPTSEAAPAKATNSRRRIRKSAKPPRPLEFLLALDSPVVDAPSIGDKAAQRLSTVGIRTVADLLNADAESTAQELNARAVTAERFTQWQHQARLVCQIPNLRGYGAKLLVACELIEPSQIAGTDPAELATRVRRHCRTKAGQRILRNGKIPSARKIAEWVEDAAHRRPLEAA